MPIIRYRAIDYRRGDPVEALRVSEVVDEAAVTSRLPQSGGRYLEMADAVENQFGEKGIEVLERIGA